MIKRKLKKTHSAKISFDIFLLLLSPWSLNTRHSDILELNHYSFPCQDHIRKTIETFQFAKYGIIEKVFCFYVFGSDHIFTFIRNITRNIIRNNNIEIILERLKNSNKTIVKHHKY